MRILIGNDFDDSVALKRDVRSWTQRILWLVRDHDVLVLVTEPDPRFLAYVLAFTGVDAATLRVHVLPAGRFSPGELGQHMFDAQALLAPEFVDAVKRDTADASEIIALWPAAHVALFAARLGLRHLLPGAAFIGQNGGEIANNKANFRAFAAGAGVCVSDGAVARTPDDAVLHTCRLLAETTTVVVKRAHAGAGAGNLLLSTDAALQADHCGAKFLHFIDGSDAAITDFWHEWWPWATCEGRYAVVIECYIPDARTVFAEFEIAEHGVRLKQTGELIFQGRRLAIESVPLHVAEDRTLSCLAEDGTRLAETYRAFGYRGLMCADAVTSAPGRVVFTEVNARASSSTHLYQGIARFVGAPAALSRTISQYTSPASWHTGTFDDLIAALRRSGLAYDAASRSGVLCVVPVAYEFGHGQTLLAIVHRAAEDRDAIIVQLEEVFGER